MTPRSSATLSALLIALAAPAVAQAAPQALVSGQTLSLPLTEASDEPALRFEIARATLKSSAYQPVAKVKGETRAERQARGDQVVLNNDDGRRLVKFARLAAEDLRGRYAAKGRAAKVSVTFDDGLAVNSGALWGDALKAGFTLGLGAPATVAIFFNTHMTFAIEEDGAAAQTLTCDGQAEGRMPRYPKKDDPHAREEMDRMQEAGRNACFAQITAKLAGEPAATSPATPGV
jgi:hypothetical protein